MVDSREPLNPEGEENCMNRGTIESKRRLQGLQAAPPGGYNGTIRYWIETNEDKT